MGLLAEMHAADLAKHEAAGEIEIVGNLKIYRSDLHGKLCVKIWRGKAKKPLGYFSFRTPGAREQYIARVIDGERQSAEAREQRKAQGQADLDKQLELIQVGTLLHYSWGWEQTQCDFFQVVARNGRNVTIRAINGEIVPGSDYSHGMACMMRPLRDQFAEGHHAQTLTKRIGPCGISMSYGIASPCTEADKFYCSWYA